jgi:hypothetical protein
LRRQAAPSEEVKPEMVTAEKKEHSGALWLLIVLAVGISFGALLSLFDQARGFGPGAPPPFSAMEPVMTLRVIVSTTSVALLVALVIVYFRMYMETKANFSAGLVVVLLALLLHSMISYPLVVVRGGIIPVGPGVYLSTADIFMVVAYAIFLYLSLE